MAIMIIYRKDQRDKDAGIVRVKIKIEDKDEPFDEGTLEMSDHGGMLTSAILKKRMLLEDRYEIRQLEIADTRLFFGDEENEIYKLNDQWYLENERRKDSSGIE